VRLSDIGWTDVTSTTAIFSALLQQLGYQPKITVLAVPVTFAAMKNRDIDVFLGNWMQAQSADRKPFEADGSVEVIGANLQGAKYTLAVPAYTYAAGLHDSTLRASLMHWDTRSTESNLAMTATAWCWASSSRMATSWAISS
jgi:glycine betaine/proline transport system substrate-binding protein